MHASAAGLAAGHAHLYEVINAAGQGGSRGTGPHLQNGCGALAGSMRVVGVGHHDGAGMWACCRGMCSCQAHDQVPSGGCGTMCTSSQRHRMLMTAHMRKTIIYLEKIIKTGGKYPRVEGDIRTCQTNHQTCTEHSRCPDSSIFCHGVKKRVSKDVMDKV